VTLHGVMVRYQEATPFHALCNNDKSTTITVPTKYNPMSWFVSRFWLATPVPALIKQLIDSVGPVNVAGVVSVPNFASPLISGSFPTYADGTVYPILSIGSSPALATAAASNVIGGMGLTISGTNPGLNLKPNATLVTNTTLLTYFTNGFGHLRLNFWNAQTFYFAGLWDRLHKKYLIGSTFSSSFVHTHNPPCGSAAAMLSQVVILSEQLTVSNAPPLEMGAGFGAVYTDADAEVIISLVDLSADEIVESLLLRWCTIPGGSGEQVNYGLYRFQVPGIGACTQLAETYSSKTFSAESSFSKAIAARQAKFQPVQREFAGVAVTSAGDDESCWIADLLDTVAREAFSVLRYAVPSAAGIVCSDAAGKGAGELCKYGAGKVLSSIKSYMTVEADGHPPPKKDEIKQARTYLAIKTPVLNKAKPQARRKRNKRKGKKQAQLVAPKKGKDKKKGNKTKKPKKVIYL